MFDAYPWILNGLATKNCQVSIRWGIAMGSHFGKA